MPIPVPSDLVSPVRTSLYTFFGYFGLFCGTVLVQRVLVAVFNGGLNWLPDPRDRCGGSGLVECAGASDIATSPHTRLGPPVRRSA